MIIPVAVVPLKPSLKGLLNHLPRPRGARFLCEKLQDFVGKMNSQKVMERRA
jgi:hypothetical protein